MRTKKEWVKIERKIAQNLGANQTKIYKWKREFGMMIKNSYSYEQKVQILERFYQIYDQIKIKLNEKLNGKRKKCQKIIAKRLGISLISIYKWKKQLKNGKSLETQKTEEQKREIIKKYLKIKNEFMQNGKHSRKEWEEFRAEIKQKFGVSYWTIEKWAKKLGIKQNNLKKRKRFTIVEIMKQYYLMKKETPKFSDVKIAKLLNIELMSLIKYKSEFEEKVEMF